MTRFPSEMGVIQSPLYLKDILESITRIEISFKNVTKELFNKDANLQDATIRRLEIIGEAVTNIPEEIKSRYSQIEWKKIAGFRIVAVHSYFKVNLDIIWDIVKEKIQKLKKDIKHILENENRSS